MGGKRRKASRFRYTQVGFLFDGCMYCGQTATSWDHVVPVAASVRLEGLMLKVPACQPCNSTLQDNLYTTLQDRRTHVLVYLKRKMKGLRVAEWTAEELAALKSTLRSTVIAGIKAKVELQARIDYASLPLTELRVALSGNEVVYAYKPPKPEPES